MTPCRRPARPPWRRCFWANTPRLPRRAQRTERLLRVQEALNTLDPIDREVLALRHFEQLSRSDTAEVLGISQEAGAKRYFRALKRLKDVLSTKRIIKLDPDDLLARHYDRILLYLCGDFGGHQREMHRELMSLNRPVGFEGTPCESQVLWLPPGAGSLAVESYRKSLYAQAVHHCREFIEASDHPFQLTQTHLLLAMTHQKLGQSAESRKELEVGRKLPAGLGRIHGAGFSCGESNLMNYGWTE